mmetsp:Transcript_15368/g.22892  ORF Transcript_15368/g.22892 Transcript_15368/m.22892 type:complete len:84 (+) Transcript_15368:505-756(+)
MRKAGSKFPSEWALYCADLSRRGNWFMKLFYDTLFLFPRRLVTLLYNDARPPLFLAAPSLAECARLLLLPAETYVDSSLLSSD